jgi:hypothetical protein
VPAQRGIAQALIVHRHLACYDEEMRWLVVVLFASVFAGCAHAPPVDVVARARDKVLEREFLAFTTRTVPSELAIEDELAQLEALRVRYLDALTAAETDLDRLFSLVRIAELHLDLGARIRRVPYPPALDDAQKHAFDDDLSRRALPLEAVGRGVLQQAVDYADRRDLDGRFVRRARLYLTLHEGKPLQSEDVVALRRELSGGPYAAPRRLLEAGRIGQRAARR